MYKRKILSSLVFFETPRYPGRNFWKARLEALEYSILFSARDNSEKILKFQTSEKEQREIIFNWGKMWVLIDDLQDEMMGFASNSVLRNILTGEKYPSSEQNTLLLELISCAKFVNVRVSRTQQWKKYLQLSKECFDNQLNMTSSRKKSYLVARTLYSAEKKGGAFALSLIYALNPSNITEKVAKAIFIGGSWGQAIDDFADREKDKKYTVFTIFSTAANSYETLTNLANRYEKEIFSLVNRRDFVIPLAKDLTALAKLSRFPVFSTIFRQINE